MDEMMSMSGEKARNGILDGANVVIGGASPASPQILLVLNRGTGDTRIRSAVLTDEGLLLDSGAKVPCENAVWAMQAVVASRREGVDEAFRMSLPRELQVLEICRVDLEHVDETEYSVPLDIRVSALEANAAPGSLDELNVVPPMVKRVVNQVVAMNRETRKRAGRRSGLRI